MARIAFIIDPVSQLKLQTDTTLALAQPAFNAGHDVYFIESHTMAYHAERVQALASKVERLNADFSKVLPTDIADAKNLITLAEPIVIGAQDIDVVLMRKDPPVDAGFLSLTHLLSIWEQEGVKVTNPPAALRDWNEKCLILQFPNLIARTCVSSSNRQIMEFLAEEGEIVLKPLHGMGGSGVILLSSTDEMALIKINSLTHNQAQAVMGQRKLDVSNTGDKRILLLHGEPLPAALARFPQDGGFLANLAAGGHGRVVELNDRDREIAAEIAPFVIDQKLHLVGLDVIDGHVTEINVTSPTCLREIQGETGVDYAEKFIGRLL